MKKSILNIGKELNKAQQKNVIGGGRPFTDPNDPCHIEEWQLLPLGCVCNSDTECVSGNCSSNVCAA